MSPRLNLLVSTFPGLGLPNTIAIPVDPSDAISDAVALIHDRLPCGAASRLTITALPNTILSQTSTDAIATLAPRSAAFLTLRLSTPLCGGKGGFGSQLRAAGGRMSSRKKRKQQGDPNGSSRNLDGRRLRTVAEAKDLARALALRPEMEKRERDERRRRWEEVVAAAERGQEEAKAGAAKARLSEAWVEAKEEAREKTREAVVAAVKAGEIKDVLEDSETSGDESRGSASSGRQEGHVEEERRPETSKKVASRSFHGWEEEELSESDGEDKDQGK
jgi:hypothetical protein